MTTASEHFGFDSAGVAEAQGRFVDVGTIEAVELVKGLEFRPVLGEQTMVNFVSFAPFTEAPRHAHREEQIVVVLEGELDFELDGETRTLGVGDVVVVPPFVPHGARTKARACREMDVFNPPRATLLEHARAARSGASERLGTGD